MGRRVTCRHRRIGETFHRCDCAGLVRASELIDEERAAEVRVARRFCHDRSVAEGVNEARVRDEAGRSPTFEPSEGAAHAGIKSEQLFFAGFRGHADAIWWIEAEDARLHAVHGGQHALDVFRIQRTYVLLRDDDRLLVRWTCEPNGPEVSHHVGNSSGINIECEDARHGAGKEVGRLDRQIFERGEMTQRKIHRSTDGSAGREAGRFDRNRASTCHRIDERLRARVPAREHDQLRSHRLAQRSRSHDHAGAAAMPRSSSDVDAHHRAGL